MSGYPPTLTAGLAAEHISDRIRAAERSALVADLPDRSRHQTPSHRAPWWVRVVALAAHRPVPTRT